MNYSLQQKRLLPALVFGCLLFLSSISCQQYKKQKMYTIGFSQCVDGDLWRKTMLEEMKRELSFHDNIHFIYVNADANSEKQIRQIKELVKQKIDLLIVSPNEVQPLSKCIQEVYDAGIPVVVVDRRTDSKKYTAFIGASNYEVGENAGRYAVSLLKGKGNIIEATGLPNASPVIDRHNGFMNVISQYPNIHYIKKIDDNSRPFNQVEEKTLRENAIDLIFAQNDFMAFDAYNICKKIGIENKIKIIGIDGLAADGGGIDMVANHYINGTVLYPTGGQEAILTAFNILEGNPFKKENQLFTTIIDSNNVRILKLQYQKLIDQQKSIDRSQQKIEQQEIITRNQTNIIYAISVSLALAIIFGFTLFYYLRQNKKINQQLASQNEEIKSQRNQLLELGKKAQEASDAKINFFTNMSHEFRTPLTLILGPLDELLNNAKIHFTEKKQLTLIQKNAARLLRLINQLMDFRKIEASRMQLKVTENDMVAFIEDIAESFYPLSKKRNIDFRVITTERVIVSWFDASMLDKVIFNLLSNAFKFTGDNGLIHITLEKNNLTNHVTIMVEDNGIGMTPDVAEHVFELFYQANIIDRQGSGLGLSLSKELIHLHHGSITVKSQQWKGTTFFIHIPLGKDHFTQEEISSGAPLAFINQFNEYSQLNDIVATKETDDQEEKIPGTDLQKTILVIEDNTDLNEFLTEKLGVNFQIIHTENGINGIQLAYDYIPDLIISDIILPGKDGLYIAATLKNDIKTSHIPIILLTAKTELQQQIEGMRTNADAYITKPFNYNYLLETINSVLKNREIMREHYTAELSTETKNIVPQKLDRKFINDFNAVIEANISNEQFTIEDIYNSLGISRIQLYRKVKALLNINVNDYILNMSLQKARHLLKEKELSVSEIAFKVGFSSASYFSTVFKNKFGLTPKEFKEK